MALNDNIKKLRRKKPYATAAGRQIVCFKANYLSLGERFKVSGLDYREKIGIRIRRKYG